MAYAEERRSFAQFKNALETTPTLKAQYESAIASVVLEYNTSILENRFVTGGAVEIFTMWAMRSAGIDVAQVGAQLRGSDLQLPRGGRISLKGVFAIAPQAGRAETRTTNLINVQGHIEGAVWADATFFLLAARGLYYADPDLLPDRAYPTGGALSIRMKDVVDFGARNPQFHCDLAVAEKTALTANSKVASRAVAVETVLAHNLTELQRGFPQP